MGATGARFLLLAAALTAGCGNPPAASKAPGGSSAASPAVAEKAAAIANKSASRGGPTRSGQPAPPLSLMPAEGGPNWDLLTTLDPSGASCPDAYLIAFMASWCTYCSKSLPTLVELQEQFPDLGIVTVSVDDSPEGQMKEAEKVRAAGLTGPVLVADAATRDAWLGDRGPVPHYFFVNHDGKVVSQDQGFGDKVRPLMPSQARRALGQPPADAAGAGGSGAGGSGAAGSGAGAAGAPDAATDDAETAPGATSSGATGTGATKVR